MSHYGPGHFDDADGSIERRIQEELRARQQQANSVAAASRLAGFSGSAADRAAYLNSLIAAETAAANSASSPYNFAQRAAAAGAHSPFAARPYGVLGQAGSSPAYASPSDAVAASLYARQRAQYGYGNSAASAAAERNAYANAYGVPGGGHDIYSQHFGRSEQQMTMMDRAAAYNAQKRKAEQSNPLLQQSVQSPSYGQKPSSPNASSPKSTPRPGVSTPSSASASKARPRKEPDTDSPNRTPASEKEKIKGDSTSDSEQDDDSQKWYSGSVPLGLEDDKYWLSELQVFLRANFAEAFGATEEDIAAPMHGRNKPIALGQVGIRCMHCKHENPAERGQQATSYPSLISGIYNSVQQMLRLHLDCCQAMPPHVRNKIEQLKLSSSSRGGRKQYWVDSARRLGLVDTPHGIHFGRDPNGPLPALTGPSVNSKEGRKKKEALKKEEVEPEPEPVQELEEQQQQQQQLEIPPPPVVPSLDDRPLVFPEDMELISDYLFVTLEQMSPCVLMEADRVGCYKTRKVGFPGLACKHCVGQAGCGRYFPASEASLSQTTTSQTIMNHVRNCRRCPIEIRENLEIMKRARMGPDGKRADKPKHGGRKVFFHRLWCRIQGIPMQDGKGETKEKKKRGKKSGSKKSSKKRAEAQSDNDSPSGDEREGAPPNLMESSEEDTETESSSDESDSEEPKTAEASKKNEKKSGKKSKPSNWHDGCVRLTKTDDVNWLSEMQCFLRSDLVEVFAYQEEDGLEGYTGRKEPAIGQVGVRCVTCKSLDPSEKPNGCVAFPENLSNLHTKAMDMLRLHFHSCPSMRDDTKETFKTLRGFGPKVADDSQQYWVDSARDIGLSNIPPGGSENGWGISFRRNPLEPSPCDELDREVINGNPAVLGKNYLIKAEDRGICTDQVLLMMRQVRVCTFQKRDRRGGPGARGRDRVIGFPGLCCKHCASKNNSGRYFPVSAKNLTDNTANSLLSHVSTCSRCPEPIKASIAYLSHRGILQKAELSGSWKKGFFKKIWDRLHVQRAWSSASGEAEDDEEAASVSSEEEVQDESKEESDGGGSDGVERLGDNMNALIKAAAIWLTEQDQVSDPSSRIKTSRGRALPSKRPAVPSPAPKGKSRSGSSLTSGKRRRVHF